MQIDYLADKIDLLFQFFQEDRITYTQWIMYASPDVDIFHIRLRSIFDEVTKILKKISNNPKHMPKENSFKKLYTWAHKPDSSNYIDNEYLELIKETDWFETIRNYRDATVHHGADVTFAWNKKEMLFQIFGFDKKYVNIPSLMKDEATIHLNLYYGLISGYLIAFLETLFEIMSNKYNLPDLEKSHWPSEFDKKGVMYRWMEMVIDTIFT